jgi:hypothetical protein
LKPKEIDSDSANETIMKRYFGYYGPATLQDFAYWRGTTMANTRRWFPNVEADLTKVRAYLGFLKSE